MKNALKVVMNLEPKWLRVLQVCLGRHVFFRNPSPACQNLMNFDTDDTVRRSEAFDNVSLVRMLRLVWGRDGEFQTRKISLKHGAIGLEIIMQTTSCLAQAQEEQHSKSENTFCLHKFLSLSMNTEPLCQMRVRPCPTMCVRGTAAVRCNTVLCRRVM